ncbi:MAG: multiheme c-type cytochrome, partial [Chitinophagaceae bacterium]
RMDIIFGSGSKGQSYLNCYNNRLLQMPITYFTAANQWSNSPGFPDKAVFSRPVTSRCVECHSTYAQNISGPTSQWEEFDRNKILYGVDCEKCHGPAASHVQFQTQHPEEAKGKFIVNPAALSRQQNIDMCALCHGGSLSKTKPSFEFSVGDTLSNYFSIDTASKDATSIDVHGNQYGLLAASKCFKGSNITCSSCHNTHENERGKLALFSKRCMNCHNNEHKNFCTMPGKEGVSIVKNCIDCHMPKQPSRSIAVMLQGATTSTPALMRSHLIKIYPQETKKVLPFISSNPSSNQTQ